MILFLAVRTPKQFSVMGDDTANTTVTSADEFVWIDSYNRLVELQVNYLSYIMKVFKWTIILRKNHCVFLIVSFLINIKNTSRKKKTQKLQCVSGVMQPLKDNDCKYFENKISSFIQKLPWNTADLFKSISQGKDMSQLPQDELICGDLLPRLSYYLQVRRNYYKSWNVFVYSLYWLTFNSRQWLLLKVTAICFIFIFILWIFEVFSGQQLCIYII